MSPAVNGVFRLPGGTFRGVGTVGVPVTFDLCSNNDVCPHSTVDNVCIFIGVLSVFYMEYYLLRASSKIVYFSLRHFYMQLHAVELKQMYFSTEAVLTDKSRACLGGR